MPTQKREAVHVLPHEHATSTEVGLVSALVCLGRHGTHHSKGGQCAMRP